MTPTPLTPTNLYAVSVPKGAKDFTIQPFDTWTELYWKEPFYNFREVGRMRRIEGIFTLVGLVTKDTIDFDAHKYIDSTASQNHIPGRIYRNYATGKSCSLLDCFQSPDRSFRTLLSANECWFENPFPHPVDVDPAQRAHYDEIVADWQAAQTKVHECWAIIEKV